MVLSIVRDAVHIKMKLRNESPLISVYEFCYAAGLGLKVMGVAAEEAAGYKDAESFQDMKTSVQEMVKESDKFEDYPNGPRLQSLITGCRIRGEMSEDARALFDMGYAGK